MPTFFFNVDCDDTQLTDIVGEDCACAEEARHEAHRLARELVQQRLLDGRHPSAGWVEVEDEEHRPILRLPLRAAAC